MTNKTDIHFSKGWQINIL